jgi:hypothetical protein
MSGKPDYVRKKFAPLLDKNLENALAHRIGREFPRVGGPRIRSLCARMIMEVLQDHLRPRENLHHGQVLWLGISVDDPPSRGKRTADTDLVPLVLDLSTPQDVRDIIERVPTSERVLKKALRLCHQAHEQGALLSNSDLEELLSKDDSHISALLAAHERRTGTVVPRRATIHDVGSGVTHKRIICWKRYAEGKETERIARETYHSLEAVDRYLGQFDRVRHCVKQGLPPPEIAFTLNMSRGLVEEYLAIDRELGGGDD